MKESEFKPIAREWLKELGLETRDIPRRDSKTPDFDVIGRSSRYTMELKIKGDDPKEMEKDSEKLAQGEIVSRSIPTGPRNRLYAIVKEAAEQMTEYDPAHKTLHVVWIHCTGKDASLHRMRLHSTLFGARDLFSRRRKNLITCYYFNESAFFACRDTLDGSLLTYRNEVQLCVNTLSPRLKTFQNSDLYSRLGRGVCDPDAVQDSDSVMIADWDVDRKNSEKMIQLLKEKYKLDHLQTIDMMQHSGTMLVPDEQ